MDALLYAALGDSAGVGVGARDGKGYVDRVFTRLVHKVPGARLANLCISGATSGTVKDRQVDRALAIKPSLITLFIGGNDLWRMVDPEQYRRNITEIAARLAKTNAPVLMGTLANMAHAPAAAYAERAFGIPKWAIEERVVDFNKAVLDVAAQHRFTVVDLFSVGIVDRPHYFCGDGFHPSAEGYAAWADMLWPAMEAAVAAAATAA